LVRVFLLELSWALAKVLGVGGVFFRAKDPQALAAWYGKHLGMELDDDTKYFEPSDQRYMINLVVDDLTGALEQVADAGAQLVGARQDEVYGSFAWFLDPEGNKVELWQPKVMA